MHIVDSNYFNIYGTDITERVRADEERRSSRKILKAVIDNSSAIIYVKDLEGKYILINSMFEKIFHILREDAVGKTDYELLPKKTADALRVADFKVLEHNMPVQIEEDVPHDDGMHHYVSIKFPLCDDSGKLIAVCGMSTDITERKKSEKDMQIYVEELEFYKKVTVEREIKLIELKKEVNTLYKKLGQTDKYDLSFADDKEQGE
ncbi:MAG: PAS domain-containing protein [Candidatus Zapsychrus exili]|nr:PAS domain-containing protein [Candidatus Zapsychrus exili]